LKLAFPIKEFGRCGDLLCAYGPGLITVNGVLTFKVVIQFGKI